MVRQGWRLGPWAIGLVMLPMPLVAADVSAYAALTTDYVFRGVTYSDGDPAAQLGVDVSFTSGIYAGVWGSTIDIDSPPFSKRDREVTYYLGYSHDLTRDWTIAVNAVAYTYPGASGTVDYDYEEYGVSFNYRDRVWYEYAYSPDVYNSSSETHNYRLHVEWQLPAALVGSAGVGYYDVSRLSDDSYAYWEAGVTRSFGRVDVDLRYHDTSRWVRIISDPDRSDPRVALTARLQF